uniref:Uncharacterized protein n=1 Tax=Ixodes ricinus TaxID=34613 RepID=A0A6B0UEI5_IXORI
MGLFRSFHGACAAVADRSPPFLVAWCVPLGTAGGSCGRAFPSSLTCPNAVPLSAAATRASVAVYVSLGFFLLACTRRSGSCGFGRSGETMWTAPRGCV